MDHVLATRAIRFHLCTSVPARAWSSLLHVLQPPTQHHRQCCWLCFGYTQIAFTASCFLFSIHPRSTYCLPLCACQLTTWAPWRGSYRFPGCSRQAVKSTATSGLPCCGRSQNAREGLPRLDNERHADMPYFLTQGLEPCPTHRNRVVTTHHL